MPKAKKNKKYSKKYQEDDIQRALAAIKSGMPKKKATQIFGVPRATLQFRLAPKFTKIEPGRSTDLSIEEENDLIKWLLESHRKGFPRRKIDVQLSVKAFLDAEGRKTPFKDNMPGIIGTACSLNVIRNYQSAHPKE